MACAAVAETSAAVAGIAVQTADVLDSAMETAGQRTETSAIRLQLIDSAAAAEETNRN